MIGPHGEGAKKEIDFFLRKFEVRWRNLLENPSHKSQTAAGDINDISRVLKFRSEFCGMRPGGHLRNVCSGSTGRHCCFRGLLLPSQVGRVLRGQGMLEL